MGCPKGAKFREKGYRCRLKHDGGLRGDLRLCERRIVDIALRVAGIERRRIGRRQRRTLAQPLNQIGVRYEWLSEADEVGEVLGARLDGKLEIVAVVGHVEAVEGAAQLLQVEAAGGVA